MLFRSNVKNTPLSDLLRNLFPDLITRSCEGITYKRSTGLCDEFQVRQIPHIDVAPGNDVDNPKTWENMGELSEPPGKRPVVMWTALQDETGLVVYLESHTYVLKCLEFAVKHYRRFRAFWKTQNPADSNQEFQSAWNACLDSYLSESFPKRQRIVARRLVPEPCQLVLMDGCTVHGGTCDEGIRIFKLLASKVTKIKFLSFFQACSG